MATIAHPTSHTESSSELVLYTTKDGRVALDARLAHETIWLNLNQLAALFERDKSVVSRHLRNIFSSNELERTSTVALFATVQDEGGHPVTRHVEHFSLDAIISVGYRVNSKRGTQFRIWATQVLRDHILKGFTLNEQRLNTELARLRELQAAVDLMGRVLAEKPINAVEAEGLLRVISDYSLALRLLDQYDHQQLRLHGTSATSRFVLTYDAATHAIAHMAVTMGPAAAGLFGREKDKGLASAIGAFLFIWFLDANGLLYRADGSKRLADNALVALTLLLAESRAGEKDIICKVIVNLINRENL
jgi:hypothetical protein